MQITITKITYFQNSDFLFHQNAKTISVIIMDNKPNKNNKYIRVAEIRAFSC